MDSTSLSLLQRLRRPSDPEAWSRFVKLYTPLLYGWARRLGLQPTDAADLVQDVFTLLLRKLPEFQYDPRQRFRGWLWTVTVNRYRTLRRRRPPPAVAGNDATLGEVAGPDPIEEMAEAEYRHYLVQRVLRLLQAEFPAVVWEAWSQHFVGGRSATEVAAALGISVNAVYIAKCRILRRLRTELDGFLD
jgi:RNA polymerase sigma-70 factor (ECF subfamily)